MRLERYRVLVGGEKLVGFVCSFMFELKEEGKEGEIELWRDVYGLFGFGEEICWCGKGVNLWIFYWCECAKDGSDQY